MNTHDISYSVEELLTQPLSNQTQVYQLLENSVDPDQLAFELIWINTVSHSACESVLMQPNWLEIKHLDSHLTVILTEKQFLLHQLNLLGYWQQTVLSVDGPLEKKMGSIHVYKTSLLTM